MVLDTVFAHVLEKIKQAPIKQDPYPHFFIENIFPEPFYRTLLSMLPNVQLLAPLGSTKKVASGFYNERKIFELENNQIMTLPSLQFLFWKSFASALGSSSFCKALMSLFEEALRARYGSLYDTVGFSSTAELLYDHYSIGPHTDHPIRALTMLFYLPKDESQSHLGTSIYKPHDPSFKCSGLEHHGFNGFDRVYTAPFLPNTLFGFIKSDTSFHGVEPISDQKVSRNLINFYIKSDKVLV